MSMVMIITNFHWFHYSRTCLERSLVRTDDKEQDTQQAPVSQTVSNSDSTSTQALKNPVSKKEGKLHTNNQCPLNDLITISNLDKYDGIIFNFS